MTTPLPLTSSDDRGAAPQFRMIPFRYFPAAMNMGIDEAILDGLKEGTSPPTIRSRRAAG